VEARPGPRAQYASAAGAQNSSRTHTARLADSNASMASHHVAESGSCRAPTALPVMHHGPMTEYRAEFDADVTFLNGGGLQAQGFKLDVPDPEISSRASLSASSAC
jgi:hypothetical protein